LTGGEKDTVKTTPYHVCAGGVKEGKKGGGRIKKARNLEEGRREKGNCSGTGRER